MGTMNNSYETELDNAKIDMANLLYYSAHMNTADKMFDTFKASMGGQVVATYTPPERVLSTPSY